jgi:hypothetical protein
MVNPSKDGTFSGDQPDTNLAKDGVGWGMAKLTTASGVWYLAADDAEAGRWWSQVAPVETRVILTPAELRVLADSRIGATSDLLPDLHAAKAVFGPGCRLEAIRARSGAVAPTEGREGGSGQPGASTGAPPIATRELKALNARLTAQRGS